MATGFRTIILAGLAIAGLGSVVLPDSKFNDALPTQDRNVQALGGNAELFGPLQVTATGKPSPSDADAGQTAPAGLAETEERKTTLATSLQMRAPESLRPSLLNSIAVLGVRRIELPSSNSISARPRSISASALAHMSA